MSVTAVQTKPETQTAAPSRITSEAVRQYIGKLDWQVKENSNMGFSLQGMNNYVASEVSKRYWLEELYPADIAQAHDSGDLHLHDLGSLSVYCVGWDLYDLLLHGFGGVKGKVESAPAKHFRTALGQIVNFFYTLQGEAAGAQAFSNFDTLLAPYIRRDGLGYREVKQALQEFVFNMNVPTRVGFQTPFTNVTMDLQAPSYLAERPILIGGEPQEETYGQFQKEMDLLNAAFLEVLSEGDARGRVFTFPIPTYSITADFDWDNDGLDRLWEVTAKYGIPYFSNFVNSDMSPEDARSMCCRLRLKTEGLERRGGGLFGSHPLTGSVGVVTLNMPRLGWLAQDEEDFMHRLDDLMDLSRRSLKIKRETIERLTDGGLYPYTRHYLRGMKERSGSYWTNHFSTVGLVGMNEACLNLLGEGIETERGSAFAARVLDHMRERLELFQEETGDRFNLEATPAEGAGYRLARLDRERHQGIRFANAEAVAAGAEPYYTNSTQLPVNATDDVFGALDLQDPLQRRYTGGTVQHIFLGERIEDPQAVKRLVRQVCERYELPYFTLSPTFSVCPQHGYRDGEVRECADCGSECEVYARVVGYLSPVDRWNAGKAAEFADRKSFDTALW